MPNVSEKKKKLLCLARIFLEKTDPEHTLTLPDLLRELDALGIPAERKSIYDDIETLRSVGMQIGTRKEKTFQYYLESRLFSMKELSLLADGLRPLPPKRAEPILEKLETLCSVYQAAGLRQARKLPEEKVKPEGEKLVLEAAADCAEQIRERFGSDIPSEPAGKNRLRFTVRTEPDTSFFAWLFSQGTEVRLVSPKKLAEQFREKAKSVAKLYKN